MPRLKLFSVLLILTLLVNACSPASPAPPIERVTRPAVPPAVAVARPSLTPLRSTPRATLTPLQARPNPTLTPLGAKTVSTSTPLQASAVPTNTPLRPVPLPNPDRAGIYMTRITADSLDQGIQASRQLMVYELASPNISRCGISNASTETVAQTLILDFIPVVGEVKMFGEALTGCDTVTNEDLGAWRYLGLLGPVALFELGLAKGAEKAVPLAESGEGVRVARRLVYDSEEFAGLMERASDVGAVSGRRFELARSGGEIERLSVADYSINREGITLVEKHLSRFETFQPNEVMVNRLKRIAAGEIEATPQDLNFYAHESREFERYRALGWEKGLPEGEANAAALWNNAHTASLEDLRIPNEQLLYHPDAGLPEAQARIVNLETYGGTGFDFSRSNYRREFENVEPHPAELQHPEDHHMLPQAFEKNFEKLGINIHEPKWQTWVEGDFHRDFSHEYNTGWRLWLADNEGASLQEVATQAAQMARKYHLNWVYR